MAALLCARPRAPANPAVVNVTDEADEIEAAAVDEAERAPAVATSERGLPSGLVIDLRPGMGKDNKRKRQPVSMLPVEVGVGSDDDGDGDGDGMAQRQQREHAEQVECARKVLWTKINKERSRMIPLRRRPRALCWCRRRWHSF